MRCEIEGAGVEWEWQEGVGVEGNRIRWWVIGMQGEGKWNFGMSWSGRGRGRRENSRRKRREVGRGRGKGVQRWDVRRRDSG